MAPRANWKGFLRLSLVACPVALYPATSDADKVSFNQINKNTGHRIKYMKVDAESGEEVSNDDIIKGYPVDKGNYIPVTKDELENVALESTRTIDIDEFVHKDGIDTRYLIRPYYLVPVGHDAFAVIRETIRKMGMVAIGRVVLTSREHIIAIEPLGKGLMGNLLRYPYEVRDEKDYFDNIQDVKVTKDMLDLAQHIVEGKSGEFEPEKFEDHYESALTELINRKRAGQPIKVAAPSRTSGNVVDLMDALRKSLAGGQQSAPAAKAKKTKKRAAGQKEMLLPISGEAKDGRPMGRKHPSQRGLAHARERRVSGPGEWPMPHLTSKTWTPEDCERLKRMVRQRVSAARAAVFFRRLIAGVKLQAKRLGTPFPDERVLKRERRSTSEKPSEYDRRQTERRLSDRLGTAR